MPTEVFNAKCPEAKPIIDRGFSAQPPLCVIARTQFKFICTPDPNREGYCKETFADVGLRAVGSIADDDTCMKQVADWIAGEREADKGLPNG